MLKRTPGARAFFVLRLALVWSAAWLYFYLVRLWGVDDMPFIELSDDPRVGLHVLVSSGFGGLFGLMYGLLELLFERRTFQRWSYGRLILVKSLGYFAAATLAFLLGVSVMERTSTGQVDPAIVWERFTGRPFGIGMSYMIIVSVMISFTRQVNQKFGPGVLWSMLKGKYHEPREEERIFMFLDLQSSTTIAEQLGHIRYSRLIQDCFFDLTQVILDHRVDVYQYVGDEAVLSWTVERGVEKNHCLESYFHFMRILEARSDHYLKEYGIRPVFKAGVHFGRVTVAEVGVVKKEIAFHGDVLNTTARMQGKCNALEQRLLISEDLRNQLNLGRRFEATAKGEVELRGKRDSVAIFGVKKAC
ncbi:MAG: adenylate/guanylate cyclase domain-containing protein [Planctomycetota bacterium]|jgi:adenylate cyclase